MWAGFGLNVTVSKCYFLTVVLAVVAYWMDCFRRQVTVGTPEDVKEVRKQTKPQTPESNFWESLSAFPGLYLPRAAIHLACSACGTVLKTVGSLEGGDWLVENLAWG